MNYLSSKAEKNVNKGFGKNKGKNDVVILECVKNKEKNKKFIETTLENRIKPFF